MANVLRRAAGTDSSHRPTLTVEVEPPARRRVRFRHDVVTGPGGSQILLIDPSGNMVELFRPAARCTLRVPSRERFHVPVKP